MGFLALSIALGSSLFYIVQSIIKFNDINIVMDIYSIGLALICIVVYFIPIIKSRRIRKLDILIFLFIGIICICYCITRITYGYIVDLHRTQILMFFIHGVPCILIASRIDNNILEDIEKWVQPIMLLYTISILRIILFSDLLNSDRGVQALNDSSIGMTYQNISYYIAYALGFNIFLIRYSKDINRFKLFRNKIWDGINILLLPIQVLCLLSAGGRGGLVLACVIIAYFIAANRKKLIANYRSIIYSMIGIIFTVLIYRVLINNQYVQVGVNRILGYLSSSSISNDYRLTYHLKEAINTFQQSPIIGHGLGSVFYEFDIYTHNIFTDMLVEGGIILTIFLIAIIILFLLKINKYIKIDYKNNLIFLIFIFSFIMLLFSGYYLADTGIWFSLSYILFYNVNKFKGKEAKNDTGIKKELKKV